MRELFSSSLYLAPVLSLGAYGVGLLLKKKWKLNPLLIAIAIVIAVLKLLRIDYAAFESGSVLMTRLLTPATVCLAVPLYRQFGLLKKNAIAVLSGIVSGIVTSLCVILALSAVFSFPHALYVTLLPKSITTAIGMELSKELGGIPTLTVAAIVLTGVFGNLSAPLVLRLFRIRERVAHGVAIGSASHAIGTAKALELGEVEGAMSSLSLAVSGILTSVIALGFRGLY